MHGRHAQFYKSFNGKRSAAAGLEFVSLYLAAKFRRVAQVAVGRRRDLASRGAENYRKAPTRLLIGNFEYPGSEKQYWMVPVAEI